MRNDNCRYMVNNTVVGTWSVKQLAINEIGIRVCGKQKVAFDRLKVELPGL